MVKAPYKVCILTAGKGTRVNEYTDIINKALLPVRGQAILSRIIDQFPDAAEIVVALGYKAEQVTSYLEIAHGEQNINTVIVSPFEGVGSGPGYSLKSCESALAGYPFYFVACDTLFENNEDIISDRSRNWVGVASIAAEESADYCNMIVENERVVKIIDKKNVQSSQSFAFTGLAYIKDHEDFWKSLSANEQSENEVQMVIGFENFIMDKKLFFKKINWVDIGTKNKYIQEIKKTENYDFSKTNEFLYFRPKQVIKFFKDQNIVEMRVKKAHLNADVFPPITNMKTQFYAYSYLSGIVLYEAINNQKLKEFLNWCNENLWLPSQINTSDMSQMCRDFYLDKTEKRLSMYHQKHPKNSIDYVDGYKTLTDIELLHLLNWQELQQGVPRFIHGDLQPDNILIIPDNKGFVLLDWRQDFSGKEHFGDLYYDFAKLWGGLKIDYSQIKKNNFTYTELEKSCQISYASVENSEQLIQTLEKYISDAGFSVKKVKTIVGLIYLNMSPLHHEPFDKLLHGLGRKILQESIS